MTGPKCNGRLINMKKKVLLTGATGVMGSAALPLVVSHPDEVDLRLFALPTPSDRKKLAPYLSKSNVSVTWGDLTQYGDVKRALEGVDMVIHLAAMVSPQADWNPQKTILVNIGAMKNIIRAIDELGRNDSTSVVYIGSVAQYGYHSLDNPWGAAGDPLLPSLFDAYAYSKNEAERLLTESGITRWVSLRQSGILHPGLLLKTNDPIMFHVPLRGVLEWATVEDSARLVESLCLTDLPASFWRNFYNISSGESYRLTNYEFEVKLLKAIGCPAPERVFDANWFATRNFHGMWYADADLLEKYLHFRENISADEYFTRMAKQLPWYFRLSKLAPASAIRIAMRHVAHTRLLGPLWWLKNDRTDRIRAFFGSREEWERIPDWKNQPCLMARDRDRCAVPAVEIGVSDKALLDSPGFDTPENLQCPLGHHYRLTPRARLLGGHGCPQCGLMRAKGKS